MLQPLPPGFPTPDPKDPEKVARELGRASAMWMRGAYADAAKKVEEVARIVTEEQAQDSRRIDPARAASLLRVSAALSTLVEEMTTRGVSDPSSIAISLEIDTANLTDSELAAAQSMEIASRDLEPVDAPPSAPAAGSARPPPLPPRPPRRLATTMQQASRPTIPGAPPAVVVRESNVGSAHTIDLRRTLPEGVRDPRVPKPTPRPFAKVDPVHAEGESARTAAISDPFADLDVPSSELGTPPTTNPVPFGANYPPSEALPSAQTTRRAPQPDMTSPESTEPDPAKKRP